MLLTEMTSRKSSENKSRSYRQCVESLQGPPKLKYPKNIDHRSYDIIQFMDYLQDFNMVKMDSRLQTMIESGGDRPSIMCINMQKC